VSSPAPSTPDASHSIVEDAGFYFGIRSQGKMSGGVSARLVLALLWRNETISRAFVGERAMIAMRADIVRKFSCVVASLLFFPACGLKPTTSVPDREIREGWRQYRLSEFNAALRSFEAVRANQPPGSEYYLQALYGEASCWNHRRDGRDIAKAVAGYRAVIREAPQSPLAAWCALDIVRTRHLGPADQPVDYEQLVRDYADVYQRYPNTPAGEEAFLYETTLSLPAADPERVRKILDSVFAFLSSHPKTPYLSQFYGVIAECYRKIDEQDQRLLYMVKALEAREVDPSNPNDDRSTAYWNIAYAAEFDAGDFALAREYYNRLLTEYPQDVRVFGVRKALERMDAVEAALREGRNPAPDLLGAFRR
jgi:tetratricopeptide (TPR) repeat protein